MDTRMLGRLQAIALTETTASATDPVVVLGMRECDIDLRGGARADIDRLHAADTAYAARKRVAWRPPIGNSAVAQQFSAPPPGNARTGDTQPIAIKMPLAGSSRSPEVTLFW